MRLGSVHVGDLIDEGRRLTGGFHLAEDQQIIHVLDHYVRAGRFLPLKSLTTGRRVFRGPIFKRIFATDSAHGRPYVSAADLVQIDVNPTKYLSNRHGSLLEELSIRSGWILVTCSGMNLGKAIWAREEMDGLCASHDLIRIEPNESEAPPGYVFAFLSSRFGRVSIRKQIYGGNIKHIEPQHILDLPVPRLGAAIELKIHEMIVEAASLRTSASEQLAQATKDLERELSVPAIHQGSSARSLGHNVTSAELQRARRLEAFFFNPVSLSLVRWAEDHEWGAWTLGEVADVYDVPPFKHIYVDGAFGVPFYTSGDLFHLDRTVEKYLSTKLTRNLSKYVIEQGWILLARSGQLGGIIGRLSFADSTMHRVTTSDHVIRVIPREHRIPAGYLYAYLAAPNIGYPLLTRTMTGASVPALWPSQLTTIPVVKARPEFMHVTDRLVRDAFEKRARAATLDAQAQELVERAIEESI